MWQTPERFRGPAVITEDTMTLPRQYDLLICNGEITAPSLMYQLAENADFVVCADGGANAAADLGIVPRAVVGDFDSITADARAFCEEKGAELLHLTRQDDTDFEKALLLLRERGTEHLVITGVTGKLLDHTLGNFSILLRYVQDFSIILFDADFRIDVLTTGGIFDSHEGQRISIVPLTASHNVSYRGLRYPLTGETLEYGLREGTCNEAIGNSFEIAFSEGVLLLFRPI